MKTANITIEFDAVKLNALQFHLAKSNVSLEDELQKSIQKLYEKNIPANVREYVEYTAEAVQESPVRNK